MNMTFVSIECNVSYNSFSKTNCFYSFFMDGLFKKKRLLL